MYLHLQKIPLPAHTLSTLRDITLFIDIFYVNGSPFFLTKIGKINYIYATFLTSRRASRILTAFLRDRDRYEARGFRVTDVHGDNEFNIHSFIDAIQPENFHPYEKGEHVGVIENTVKFIKKRT